MIAFNYDLQGQAAINKGVWLAMDQQEDKKWMGVRGYVASRDDAENIVRCLTGKGYFAAAEEYQMDKNTGQIIHPVDTIRMMAQGMELVKVMHLQIRAKGENWQEAEPYKNTKSLKPEDFLSHFFRKNPREGRSEIDEMDTALLAMIKDITAVKSPPSRT